METKKITSKDGTKITFLVMDGKQQLHNWEGPALVSKDRQKVEYYLYGIKYPKNKWEQRARKMVKTR